ncbi:MAG: phosphotransferase, partial [Gemmatimonadota bacterium]
MIQTHLSTVFLAGPYAYKVKKPVDFGFVDFSTLERRRHFCHEEVRLNRRLAPGVYHGVVPIVAAPEGLRVLDAPLENPSATPPIPGGGEVVEWAVRMLRLPPERTLKSLLRRGELDGPRGAALLERLARLLADFHRTARRGAEISRVADFEGVGATARENLDQLRDAVGATLRPEVLERLREGSERTLGALRTQIEERARENRPCDTHGDLRLGHVYLLGDGESGGRIVIVDCIEFAARFRYADPVSDIAFLTMELEFEDRPDLARAFTDHYLRDAADPEGAALLPYWIAYRDIVRGKVRTLAARDPSISRPERVKSASRATRHFLRALVRLAPEDERPVLVLLGGLPGVGKSQLARSLSEASDFTWIDTDRVRRELTGSLPAPEAPTVFEAGAYAPAWTERTYEACL